MAERPEFAEFVAARSPALVRTALLTGDGASAEDLLQDSLATSWRRWSRRTVRIGTALVPLVLVAACSSVASSSGASSVERSTASLVAIGPPTSAWVPVDSEVLGAVVDPGGQRTMVVDRVPVLLRADANGTVTDAATGWMRRVPAAQAIAACSETEHWAALAEERYGLVGMAGGLTVSESCGMIDVANGEGMPVAGECEAMTEGANSTCMYIGADPVVGGQVRVTAILVRSHVPA